MKLKYDNLEDVKTKLQSTYCMYKDKAVVIKAVNQLDGDKYGVMGSYMFNGRSMECMIDDPLFNCSDYNIGYVNLMRVGAWYYRVPMKQWRQGLRYDQLRLKYSKRDFCDITFSPGKPVCSMLENSYPDFDDSVKMLEGVDANIVAFHKNFAMTYDRIHKDFLVEYKGAVIGCIDKKRDFVLMEEHNHLVETLKEAVG